MLRVRLLGSVDIVDGDREIPVPGERRSSVLATLALRPGDLVSVDRIIDAVWEDDPPATARNTVQSHVAFLRRTIGVPDAIVSRPPGYLLALPPPATDLAEAEGLLAQAGASADPLERLPLYQAALALWRGGPLEGITGSGYLRRHADLLAELQVFTTERLVADQLRLGRHHDVVAGLERLVLDHPLRERPTQLLVTALYRSGRAADALAAYRRLETDLRDELGVEPGRALVTLQQRVLQADPALLVPAGRGRPVPTPTGRATRPALVRRHMTRLVGRDAELAEAQLLLQRSRLVTVVGMGGVGKTRLAWEVLDRAARQEVTTEMVDLTPAEAEGLAGFVATALSITVEPGQPVEAAIAEALGSKERLLMVDNCEAVVERVAEFVDDLLSRTTGLRILATSREPLHANGEECLLLGPLSFDVADVPGGRTSPAVMLLADRARAADPAFVVGPDNRATLDQLCRAVDGLPLALEIIGPRLRSLTPAELAEGLGSRLLSWRDARRAVSDRHRSIGSLMEWSYVLLGPAEARAMDILSSLRGGAWLTEAADLCDLDPATGEELILGLIDRSLVVRSEVDGRSRVSLHSLVRVYAESRLAADGRLEEVAERHACWVESLVEASAARWHGPDEARLLRRLAADNANIAAALHWRREHHPERLAALVGGLWWYWFRTGEAVEGLRWAREAVDEPADLEEPEGSASRDSLAGPESQADDARGRDDTLVLDPAAVTAATSATASAYAADAATAYAAAGYLSWLVDAYDDAESYAAAALALAGGLPTTVGFAEGVLARSMGDRGEFDRAADHARRSIAAYESAKDTWGVAWSRRCLAGALLFGGQVAQAAQECERSRVEFVRVDDVWGVAGTLDLASQIAVAQSRPTDALALAAEAVEAHRACSDPSGQRYALQHLAQSYWELGEVGTSARLALESLDLSERHGYQVGALQAVQLLEDLRTAEGDQIAATRLRDRAAQLVAVLGPAAEVSLGIAARRRQPSSGSV